MRKKKDSSKHTSIDLFYSEEEKHIQKHEEHKKKREEFEQVVFEHMKNHTKKILKEQKSKK